MLIYHPAQDINHCIFRTLLLLENSVHESIDVDLYRLLDFYILFPHLLKKISPLPSPIKGYKRLLVEIPEPFESMINIKRVLHELEQLQTVALQNLIAKQIIDIESFKLRKIKRTKEPIPENLLKEITLCAIAQEEWFRMLANEFPILEFSGKHGLKKRTGLMEFRYDMEDR